MRRVAHLLRPRRDEEQGFFLVFFALMLVLLLGLAGLAVDFSNWTYQGQQEQKAADAAALAGAVYLPDDPPTAFATARDVASKNGYTNDGTTTVVIQQGARANQLNVTITRTITNIFAQAIGYSTRTITRTATGEYRKPIPMGSPTSQFGNDPESGKTQPDSQYPGFWASIQGGNTDKAWGDAYAAGVCGRDPALNGVADNCSSGANTEYDKNGYTYTVHIPDGAGSLTLQAFDPVYVPTGLFCDPAINNYGAASGLDPKSIPGYPTAGVAPGVRYARGIPDTGIGPDKSNVPQYCPGDQEFSHLEGGLGPNQSVDTTFTTTGPATIPGDPNSVKTSPICSSTFKGYNGTDIAADLKLNTPYVSTAPVAGQSTALGAMFHAWYPLCQISGPGDFFVQVKTPNGGNGENNFALRVCGSNSVTSCRPVSGVGIYGSARMSIFANIGGGPTSAFHLARVLPGAEGRSLVVSAFDLGDGNAAGRFTITGPDGTVSGCAYTPPGTTSRSGPPWGTFQPVSGCTVSNVGATYNGRWIQIKIPIPTDYNCDATDPNDCWFKISFSFPSAAKDTSTWSTYLDGDPVRLTQ